MPNNYAQALLGDVLRLHSTLSQQITMLNYLFFFFCLLPMSLECFSRAMSVATLFSLKRGTIVIILSYYSYKENKSDTLTPTLPLQTLLTAVLRDKTFYVLNDKTKSRKVNCCQKTHEDSNLCLMAPRVLWASIIYEGGKLDCQDHLFHCVILLKSEILSWSWLG